ncbi:MAG: CDP-diacylglycerol--serine O-phosphatidyltransferase [Holophagaceae bacterium]|nr:CDP-diacylglycerol--serine O-phosphatidyltransferase [Holophagaceae bacterium]
MNPEERREHRRELRRRAVQRSKFALPSGITMLSVFCGFSSVVMSINAAGDNPSGYFLWAAALLVAAGFFDGMDGRVARAMNTATEFGVQLDSLADVVSFGMAPAILAYRYAFFTLGAVDHQLRAVGWGACFFFTACGALRLARFNVQVGSVDPRFFVGLPIPAGAACVAAVILCWPQPPSDHRFAYAFAAELFLVGLLMVSTVRFPSFKKKPATRSARFGMLVAMVLLMSLFVIFKEWFVLGFLALFITAGILMNLAWLAGWKGVEPPHPPLAEDEETVH